MKKIISSRKFRKDFKRYQNKGDKVKKLFEIIELLKNDIPIPKEHKPHFLSGDYDGYMECHIESDYLLIWLDVSSDVVKLVRLGTHPELFNK